MAANGMFAMQLNKVTITSKTADATPIQIVGAVTATVTPNIETKELKGDSKTLAVFSSTSDLDIALDVNTIPAEGLSAIFGMASSVGTPLKINSTATVVPVSLEFEWAYTKSGGGTVATGIAPNAIMTATNFSVNDTSGDFGKTSITFKAIADEDTDVIFEITEA